MRLCFAGTEGKAFYEIARQGGATSFLNSAYSLDYKKKPVVDENDFFLLDSGGFSVRTKQKTLSVGKYIDYINNNNFKLVFNLDTKSFIQTRDNYRLIKKETEAKVIPVYQLDYFLDGKEKREYLKELVEDTDYIGIAGAIYSKNGVEKTRSYLNYVFSNLKEDTKLHGLAVTNIALLYDYCFYSVDSTTWFNGGKFGTVYSFEDDKFQQYEGVKKIIRDGSKIETIKSLYNYKDRILEGAKAFVGVEKFITEYWKKRGKTFAD